MNKVPKLVLFLALVIITNQGISQDRVVIDEVVGVVGNSVLLRSEIFNQRRQLESQRVNLGSKPDCSVLDEALLQKLFLNQALIDSVEVSDENIERILNQRMSVFINQIGSRDLLEEYYGKTVDAIKDDLRDIVREQELSRMFESQVTKNVRVTPSEVRAFFNSIPVDQIPIVESELVLKQIVLKPPISDFEVELARERLGEYRRRVLEGESFSTLAIMYSEDPGSRSKGGELGFHGRGELFAEFERVAYSLRPGEMSDIVETKAGFHLIQMIERRGELINVRHILLQPKVSQVDLIAASRRLDSIRNAIIEGTISFDEAALKFSDDSGKINQGLMVNPYTLSTRFSTRQLQEVEPLVFRTVDQMGVNDISRPIGMKTEDNRDAFRIVKLVSRTEPHPANLQQDYDYIQELALQDKKRTAVIGWINRILPNTHVYIHPQYHDCVFQFNWINE
jgi:peptidyl-prolyl cis-trans isomerase SurA